MKFQFEDEDYQEQAIRAVVSLFAGQPTAPGPCEVRLASDVGLRFDELALGNVLTLAEEQIVANLQAVQRAGTLPPSQSLAPFRFRQEDGRAVEKKVPNISVEMETGTGKTYVYLRTIFELARDYGWRKFIIVVPSVAIREGVGSQLRLMGDHLRQRYDSMPFESWVYNSKDLTRIRAFAASNQVQILVMNIDAFLKDTNVIRQDHDKLSGRKGIDYIQACRPVVVLDEPQNLESDKSKAAIADLNPLAVLRYSATHKHRYDLVYRLGPAAAYRAGLVKKIAVLGVLDDPNFNAPYIRLESVRSTSRKVTATLVVDQLGSSGVARGKLKVDQGADLSEATGRDSYAGYVVEDIWAERGAEYVAFANGQRVYMDQPLGAQQDAVHRAMIEETIRTHFHREREMRRLPPKRRCKVLSLFFIDHVANYWPQDGKFRIWFEELYEKHRTSAAFATLAFPPAKEVHYGYFAISKDKRAEAKDTSGSTEADNEAYRLIMQAKEELLSPDVPLRFIFSHSALAEGWDNPNVFQLCALREVHSEARRRQQLGRGLRLPVRADGTRSRETNINRLTVIANDHYKAFADGLQREIEEETGEVFKERPENERDRKAAKLVPGWERNPHFAELWRQIRVRTRYNLAFDSDELVARCVAAIKTLPASKAPAVRIEGAVLSIDEAEGVGIETYTAARTVAMEATQQGIPDALGYLHGRLPRLTRRTLARIVVESGRAGDLVVNAQAFLDAVVQKIGQELARLLVEGVEYEKLPEDLWWEQHRFADEDGYASRMVAVGRSIYDHVSVDSDIERQIAEKLGKREDIKLFLKLPRWFKVPSPVGLYNPDWAVVKEPVDGQPIVYLVRESKGTDDVEDLPDDEKRKVKAGARHFKCIDVDYKVVKSADQI